MRPKDTFVEKCKLLIWFLRHPKFYRQLTHLISKKMSPASSRQENTQDEALRWCAEVSVDTNTAIERLTGLTKLKSLTRQFPVEFEFARKMESSCPLKMGGAGNLDLLYWATEHLQATSVIETGVAYGWSSLAILLSLNGRENARLISTDMPYLQQNSEQYVGMVVPEEARSNWQILRWADRQSLPKALEQLPSIDMCHYDSDKSYEGRMWAYPKLWQALRPGGFFISDDIADNVAFREFSKAVACEPIVVQKNNHFVGVIVKPLVEKTSGGSV